MKNLYKFLLIVFVLLLAAGLVPENPLYNMNWALTSTIIIGLSLLMFFRRFENSPVTSKEIALIATMSSLAALSRIAFSAIVSVQPTTFIVMITGYVFGAQTGFMVGAVAALVSNFFLGQGPWTPWQMLCWGLCGMLAGWLGRKQEVYKPVQFIILTGACGYLYGWLINLWHWVAFIYPLNLKTLMAVYASSFVFDSMHAASNVIFALIFGPPFYRILRRFKKYLH